MIRSTMRPDPANCKVEFTKIKKNVFFLFTIMYISQKYIIFAPYLKNGTKLQQNFNINKLNFKIMKTFVFVAIKAGKQTLRKCRVYEGELKMEEVTAHVFEDEILLTFEYAHVCTF